MKKRILCFGDSNTWGWVPGSMGSERYIFERWPAILKKKLKHYEIIENGLGARTTGFDDPRPDFPGRNGTTSLPLILEENLPLDLVIIMLGTTDTKPLINKTPEEIGDAIKSLIKIIKNYRTLKDFPQPPKIILIVPPIVNEKQEFASNLFKGGEKKGKALIDIYKKISEDENIFYLNPTKKVKVDKADGVHLGIKAHKKLAKMILDFIKGIE